MYLPQIDAVTVDVHSCRTCTSPPHYANQLCDRSDNDSPVSCASFGNGFVRIRPMPETQA